jgi:hypothetical protein
MTRETCLSLLDTVVVVNTQEVTEAMMNDSGSRRIGVE